MGQLGFSFIGTLDDIDSVSWLSFLCFGIPGSLDSMGWLDALYICDFSNINSVA